MAEIRKSYLKSTVNKMEQPRKKKLALGIKKKKLQNLCHIKDRRRLQRDFLQKKFTFFTLEFIFA
jgi:hypothetical protein